MKDLSIVFIFLLTGIKCVASDAVLQYEVSRPGILCRANRYMTSFERLRIKVAKENNTGVDFPHFEALCYLPESKGGGVKVYRFKDKLKNNVKWFSDGFSDRVENVEFPSGGLRLGKARIVSDDDTGKSPRVVLSVVEEREVENRLVYMCENEPWFHYCIGTTDNQMQGIVIAGVNVDRHVLCNNGCGYVRNQYECKAGQFYDTILLEYEIDKQGDGELSEISLHINRGMITKEVDAIQIFHKALRECASFIKNIQFSIKETGGLFVVQGKAESCFKTEWEFIFYADPALQNMTLRIVSCRKTIKRDIGV